MKCPVCGNDNDKVLDSRSVRGGVAIRRRRTCMACGHRFTTYEERLRDSLMVVKRDGRLEEFSRSKLANGIERSLLKRPVSLQKIEAVIDQIVDDLESRFDLEIPAQVIGDTVMAALLKMDEVAYVRYASIYRHYEDVDQFIEEVRSLKAAAQRVSSFARRTGSISAAARATVIPPRQTAVQFPPAPLIHPSP